MMIAKLKDIRIVIDMSQFGQGIAMVLFVSCIVCNAVAQSDYEREPINYTGSTPTDPVSKLAAAVEKGESTLEWSEEHGWLTSLLEKLDIPRSSQTLVFSKTSKQFRRISPRRPRALYFNDDVYVGWVQGGDFVELGAVDPKLGAVFYSVKQKQNFRPVFERDRGECMACHANGRTKNVPGFLVRSVYAKPDGQPDFRRGSLATDHTTPLKDRFGGWYVTGSHGEMRHRGNVFVEDDEAKTSIDREAGANLSNLPDLVSVGRYLESTSDIVALMLLEHQTQMHNLVTKAGYTCRQATHQQQQMNTILERPDDYKSESTVRRIRSAAEKLIEYMFFCNEFELTSPINGSSKYTAEFTAAGGRDSKGRSLRDLDLNTRLLRYPCSYLIYSESFNALPPTMLTRVKERMVEILTGKDASEKFAHLPKSDRKSILEILTETHPLFAEQSQPTLPNSTIK